MTDVPSETADPRAVRRAAIIRLATGLAQGLLLYGLHRADKSQVWPATQRELYGALLMTVLFTPFVVLAGVAAVRARTLVLWKALAVVVVGGLAAYGVWSGAPDARGVDGLGPHNFFVFAALLFIGHHLVQPADMARRRIAPFETYFDVTWKHGVQLALSLLFTGAFWLLLGLAAQLFKLIGIDAIQTLIRQEAFSFPATTLVFAAAVQLTDVRANLVRGVRTVSLTLLAWLLPLMALIAGGFLLTLPFTGLAPLWATKKAAALLLTAAAFLIILINAAYQDGTERPHPVLAWAARIAGLLLAPITALAAYAVWLRVGQYGLTPERVVGLACVVVAAGYAIGYAIAAARPGPWMKPLEATNIAMAFVAVGVLLALASPLADPRRLSASDQVRRLQTGRIAPDAFDFEFLRFDAGRHGRKALDRLQTSADPKIARLAKAAAVLEGRTGRRDEPVRKTPRITFHPAGAAAPEGFLSALTKGSDYDPCLTGDSACDARLFDITGDGRPEVLLSGGWSIDAYGRGDDGVWRKLGSFQTQCGGPGEALTALREGRLELVAPAVRDLAIGAGTMRFNPEQGACPTRVKPLQAP